MSELSKYPGDANTVIHANTKTGKVELILQMVSPDGGDFRIEVRYSIEQVAEIMMQLAAAANEIRDHEHTN